MINDEPKKLSRVTDEPPLPRAIAEDLQATLGTRFEPLEGGFVRVVDYMGTDASIVQAARVSYGEGTRAVHEDRGLIRYLMRHHHTTPFEMCEIKLHIRAPMDTWRQWIRHRTANVNEYSTRYSIAIDDAQATRPDEWRLQAGSNKQGSDGRLPAEQGRHLTQVETDVQRFARAAYEERLTAGVAREQARKDLPLSTFTEAYWKIDLWNLLHFLDLRMREDAQQEIRLYAQIIGHKIVAHWVPLAWQAFLDYRVNSLNLSATEVELLKAILSDDKVELAGLFQSLHWLEFDERTGQLRRNRERDEFIEKMETRFGYSPKVFHDLEPQK